MSKSERMTKPEIRKTDSTLHPTLRTSAFGFLSGFDIRSSDFKMADCLGAAPSKLVLGTLPHADAQPISVESSECRVQNDGCMKHQNLQIRRKQFALDVIKLSESLPKDETSRILARQL